MISVYLLLDFVRYGAGNEMLTHIVWISCIAQKRTDCQTELSPQNSSHIPFPDVLYKSSTRGRR